MVDREKEIKDFVPEPFWILKALLENDIVAEHMDGKIFDPERAEEILSKCKGKDGSVDKIKLSNSTTKPPVPFNLGGLQAEAYNVFNFSPKKHKPLLRIYILQDILLILVPVLRNFLKV